MAPSIRDYFVVMLMMVVVVMPTIVLMVLRPGNNQRWILPQIRKEMNNFDDDVINAMSQQITTPYENDQAPTAAGDAVAAAPRQNSHRSGARASKRLKIGIIGFGKFGQFISRKFVADHDVLAMGRGDYTAVADDMGVCIFVAGVFFFVFFRGAVSVNRCI